jgi:hypothetical protein
MIVLIFLIVMIFVIFSDPVRIGITDLVEKKPLSRKTIKVLSEIDLHILYFSDKYQVPKHALMASLASEINRRIYINKISEYLQDKFFGSLLISEYWLKISINSNLRNRYLNISEQDIGIGNIRIMTAHEIVMKYNTELNFIDNNKKMVNYLLTNRGNIHIAALVIKQGMELFEEHFKDLDELNKSAVLYSYYKQGERYYNRYCVNSEFKRPPIPDPNGMYIIEKIISTQGAN